MVPVSVTVVGTEQLSQRGINDLRAVTKLAPSLQVAQDNTFSGRGVGAATFANTVEASVSQIVDEVVLGNREYAANAFYDVARVEVLNGQQGLVFGKNADHDRFGRRRGKPCWHGSAGSHSQLTFQLGLGPHCWCACRRRILI